MGIKTVDGIGQRCYHEGGYSRAVATDKNGRLYCRECGDLRPRSFYQICSQREVEAIRAAHHKGTITLTRSLKLHRVVPGDTVWIKERWDMFKYQSKITLEVLEVNGDKVKFNIKEVL